MGDKEMEARMEPKQKIFGTFKDFMTRVTKLEELGNAGNRFLLGFQQGLGFLQRPPIDSSSKLIENIIKDNETRRLKSYVEAGCVNANDAAKSVKMCSLLSILICSYVCSLVTWCSSYNPSISSEKILEQEVHTCLSGLHDHLIKAKCMLVELELLTKDAALAIETANKFSTPLDKESCGRLHEVTTDEDEVALSRPQEPEVTDYAALIAIVYSMVTRNYLMQEKIVKSLSLKSSSGELETYTLMWSLHPFVDDEIMNKAWKLVP